MQDTILMQEPNLTIVRDDDDNHNHNHMESDERKPIMTDETSVTSASSASSFFQKNKQQQQGGEDAPKQHEILLEEETAERSTPEPSSSEPQDEAPPQGLLEEEQPPPRREPQQQLHSKQQQPEPKLSSSMTLSSTFSSTTSGITTTPLSQRDANRRLLGKFQTLSTLYGREDEKAQLFKCWDRCRRHQCQEIFVIGGSPGQGKSALAQSLGDYIMDQNEQLRNDTMKQNNNNNNTLTEQTPQAFYVSAKFAETAQSGSKMIGQSNKRPLQVFVTAFSSFVYQLFHSGNSELIAQCKQVVRAALPEKLDRRSLIQMIPAFRLLLSTADTASVGSSSKGSGSLFGNLVKKAKARRGRKKTSSAAATATDGTSEDGEEEEGSVATSSREFDEEPTEAPMMDYQLRRQSSNDDDKNNSSNDNTNGQRLQLYGSEAANRLRNAFSNAVAAICKTAPLFLFLDDIQWADTSSLDVLRSLMQCEQSFPLFIVTSTRMSNKANSSQRSLNGTRQSSQHSLLGSKQASCQSLDPQASTPNGVGVVISTQDETDYSATPFMRSTLREFQRDSTVRVTTLRLKNLELQPIQSLIANVLDIADDERVAELANAAYEETYGNVFHLFQFLRLLADQGILKAETHSADATTSWSRISLTGPRNSNGNVVWSWDATKLSAEVWGNDSILDLVMRSITCMSVMVQQALKVASCLGPELDVSVMNKVLFEVDEEDDEDDVLGGKDSPSADGLLREATQEGLLVYNSQYGTYRFAHDWIRHAAFSLIPSDEVEEFHWTLGRRLWKNSESSQFAMDENIMLIVSLVNAGEKYITNLDERYQVAELNLKAAQKALMLPSFPDAARYLRTGIKYLGKNCWKERYQLSLDLYSNTAEVEISNGNYSIITTCIDQVIKHGACLDDKLQAYAALLESMQQQDDLQKATNVCVDVLNQLGERLPSKASKLTAAKEFFRVRFALRGKSDEEILSMNKMSDKRKMQCMEFLSLGFVSSWRSKSPICAFFAYRSVLLTLKYGIHRTSATSFAVFASTLCGLHMDVKDGYRFGQIALAMAEKSNSPQVVVMSNMCGSGMCVHWTHAVREVFLSLEYASKIGMETGYVSVGLQARCLSALYSLVTGNKRLSVIKKEAQDILRLSRLYHQRSNELKSSFILQVIHCYEGTAPDPSRVTGTVIDFEESLQLVQASHDQVSVVMHYMFGMELAYMHHNHEEMARMAQLSMASQSGSKPTLTAAMLDFEVALSAIVSSRQGVRKNQNIQLAKSQLKEIKSWEKDNPSLFSHWTSFLEAELMTFKPGKKIETVCTAYMDAFSLARKAEDLRVMALIREKLGDFLSGKDMKKEAVAQWNKAADIAEEWGAIALCKKLRRRVDED